MREKRRGSESVCMCVRVRVCSVLTVPIPKVVISCPSLFNARRTISLMSLLATIERDWNPSKIQEDLIRFNKIQ